MTDSLLSLLPNFYNLEKVIDFLKGHRPFSFRRIHPEVPELDQIWMSSVEWSEFLNTVSGGAACSEDSIVTRHS